MRKTIHAAGILFLLVSNAYAEPLSIDRVPEPLRPWIQWALDGHEEALCPGLQGGTAGNKTQRQCLWPARLELSLEDRTGRFRQDWQAYREGWAPLPGDAKRWPQDVQVDGRPAAVLSREGPQVRLTPGAHTITGAFQWDHLPELLQIPRETGIVGLAIRGKRVNFPNRDDKGLLWLQKSADRQEGESRLEVVVHRRVIDDIPLLLVTDIELKVSGKNREVLLGRALPQGFVPTSLSGPLPARLEGDGRLRVQVRSGDWRLELAARHKGPVYELGMADNSGAKVGPWDTEEVWVFDARPDLRLVSVEGAPSLDPQQTDLPAGWRQLPAYLMRPGDRLKFAERRRGAADLASDQLGLDRTWWLDFNGGGYSVQDRITGTLRRGWRMEMPGPAVLGRVAVAGENQFITALKTGKNGPENIGIEIRRGAVLLDADSRLDGVRFRVPAVGWDQDFHQVTGRLNLPPGWRLIHAFGVDSASPTWITRWTLLDLFIVLIAALAVGNLWGRRWGALALAALALCYHEPLAPRWVLIFILAAEALARGLPDGKLRKAAQYSRSALWLAFVIIMVPFLVTQVRVAVYPQLENQSISSGGFGGGTQLLMAPYWSSIQGKIGGSAESLSESSFDKSAEQPMEIASFRRLAADSGADEDSMDGTGAGAGGGGTALKKLAMKGEAKYGAVVSLKHPQLFMNLYAPDPRAQISTGSGMPSWRWNTVSLAWRGPVKPSQKMCLLLVGPFGNLVLALARIVLLVLLALRVLGLPAGDRLRKLFPRPRGTGVFALILIPLLALSAPQARGETPSPDTLQELRTRLLRPAGCEPDCAAIQRMKIEAGADVLRIRLEAAAGAAAGLPLPGGARQWLPAQVFLDGAPARGLYRSPDGTVYLPLKAGMHQVILEGALPDREIVDLPLPLKPRRVEAQASGWTVSGLREDGLAEENLQLIRVRGARGGPADALQGDALPPFVRVERNLRLNLFWQVDTRVVRMTPPGAAVVLEIPLLPGESVISPEVRVEKGKARVSMGPQVSEAAWTSVLAATATLNLKAPDSVPWTELWRLDSSPIWHVVPGGLPEVYSENEAGVRWREWRPWPGESVALAVSRPEGVPGQTLTIDRSALLVSPGFRAADFTLELDFRSSRGAQHTLTLPEGAELQSLAIDGRSQPIRQEKREVTVQILPGKHTAVLGWRQTGGIGPLYRVPGVKAGLPSVNSHIYVSVPEDRWVISAWGPRLGPAVLFWSVLAVMFLVSLGLGRSALTPLATRDWFLLSIGLTQVPIPVAALVAGWLLALGVRRKNIIEGRGRFNLVQAALVLWTIAALCCLYSAIDHGLLGQPEMQIAGNGSGGYQLHWYQDRAGEILPRPLLVSLPRMFYRLSMLAWALWIALSLIAWLRWGWSCLNEGGLWKAKKTLPPAA